MFGGLNQWTVDSGLREFGLFPTSRAPTTVSSLLPCLSPIQLGGIAFRDTPF